MKANGEEDKYAKDDIETAQDEMSKKSLHGCGFKIYLKNIEVLK